MKIKRVFRYSPQEKLFRVCRFIWRVGQGPGVGGENYDASLSVALCKPWQFCWKRELTGWRLRAFGIRLHRETSYGGVIV